MNIGEQDPPWKSNKMSDSQNQARKNLMNAVVVEQFRTGRGHSTAELSRNTLWLSLCTLSYSLTILPAREMGAECLFHSRSF